MGGLGGELLSHGLDLLRGGHRWGSLSALVLEEVAAPWARSEGMALPLADTHPLLDLVRLAQLVGEGLGGSSSVLVAEPVGASLIEGASTPSTLLTHGRILFVVCDMVAHSPAEHTESLRFWNLVERRFFAGIKKAPGGALRAVGLQNFILCKCSVA